MRSLVSIAALSIAATLANAQVLSGNPAADGWMAGGNSLANGTYVRLSGQFSFTTYMQEFTVAAGSNLLNNVGGSTWNVGDQVIGLGGVYVTAPTAEANGWGAGSSYNPAATNNNITSSLRMLGKFGTSASAWDASSTLPGPGNGQGSLSAGHGGLGSVNLSNSAADLTGTTSGTLRLPSVAEIYTGAGTANINAAVGRMIYIYDANNMVSSWQIMLNVTLMTSLYGNTYADLPGFGDSHIIANQRGTSTTLITDALIPTPGAAALIGLGGLAAARRRRR